MSDRITENEYLKEALEWYDEDAGQVLPGSRPHERIVDAARRFANLTSPETIEKGTKVIQLADERFYHEETAQPARWEELSDYWQKHYRGLAQAVLRSVEEGT